MRGLIHSTPIGQNALKFLWLFVVGALLLFATSSCAPKRAVYIQLTDDVEFTPQSDGKIDVDLVLKAENFNPKKFKLTQAAFNTWHNGKALGKIVLRKPVILPASYADTLTLPLAIEFESKARMLFFMLQGGYKTPEKIELEGSLHGKYGVLGKRIRVERKPLNDALKEFGLSLPAQLPF